MAAATALTLFRGQVIGLRTSYRRSLPPRSALPTLRPPDLPDQGQLDRTFLLTLLRFRRNPELHLLVATTHLTRNPEIKSQTLPRSFQYSLLFRELLTFTNSHSAVQVKAAARLQPQLRAPGQPLCCISTAQCTWAATASDVTVSLSFLLRPASSRSTL